MTKQDINNLVVDYIDNLTKDDLIISDKLIAVLTDDNQVRLIEAENLDDWYDGYLFNASFGTKVCDEYNNCENKDEFVNDTCLFYTKYNYKSAWLDTILNGNLKGGLWIRLGESGKLDESPDSDNNDIVVKLQNDIRDMRTPHNEDDLQIYEEDDENEECDDLEWLADDDGYID